MPAKIVILTGAKRGTEYLIQDDVVRIGSAATSHLQISDVAAHAVTVRYGGGSYSIYNRSGGLIDLEGEDIAENGMSPWLNGQDLQLNQETILQLRIDGDPAPQSGAAIDSSFNSKIPLEVDEEVPEPPETDLDDDEAGPAALSPEAIKARKTRNQFLLLGFLGVLFVGLMTLDSIKPTKTVTSAVDVDAALQLLIQQLTDAIDENQDPNSHRKQFWSLTKRDLQDARISEIRGNREKAVEQYRALRQRLLPHRTVSRPAEVNRTAVEEAKRSEKIDFLQLENSIDQFADDRIKSITAY